MPHHYLCQSTPQLTLKYHWILTIRQFIYITYWLRFWHEINRAQSIYIAISELERINLQNVHMNQNDTNMMVTKNNGRPTSSESTQLYVTQPHSITVYRESRTIQILAPVDIKTSQTLTFNIYYLTTVQQFPCNTSSPHFNFK